MTNYLDPYAEYERSIINPKKKKDLDEFNATHLGLWEGCKKILDENKRKKKMAILIKGERSQ